MGRIAAITFAIALWIVLWTLGAKTVAAALIPIGILVLVGAYTTYMPRIKGDV